MWLTNKLIRNYAHRVENKIFFAKKQIELCHKLTNNLKKVNSFYSIEAMKEAQNIHLSVKDDLQKLEPISQTRLDFNVVWINFLFSTNQKRKAHD